MLRRLVLLRADISDECTASIIRVKRNGELGTALAVTNKKAEYRWYRQAVM
jgi:hypothetical protein